MKISEAKWELKLLLEKKTQLQLEARSTDYEDDQRIKKLREFLDSQFDENVKTETQSAPKIEPDIVF